MYLKLGQMNIWPTRGEVNETMPEDLKQKYSSARVIIDCTEVRCQMPSTLHLNGELLSNYKHLAIVGMVPFKSTLCVTYLLHEEIWVRACLKGGHVELGMRTFHLS